MQRRAAYTLWRPGYGHIIIHAMIFSRRHSASIRKMSLIIAGIFASRPMYKSKSYKARDDDAMPLPERRTITAAYAAFLKR